MPVKVVGSEKEELTPWVASLRRPPIQIFIEEIKTCLF